MSIQYCFACDTQVDTDYDAAHFEDLKVCECQQHWHEEREEHGCPACYRWNKDVAKRVLPYAIWQKAFPV